MCLMRALFHSQPLPFQFNDDETPITDYKIHKKLNLLD